MSTGRFLYSTESHDVYGSGGIYWWKEQQNSDGTWNLRDLTGKCLTNYNDVVYVEPCGQNVDSTNAWQRWHEIPVGSVWKLQNAATNRILDGNSSAKIYTGPDNGGNNQRWD
ncbi:hypothetical protein ACFWOG_20545 [Kitasatospora sp. NPDC058406]|uniref:RICIN domain-containing protein n=1 Tax=Kitasatospora sp. NPDC058406 TaxID=3346483 RepID=UPI003647434D